LRLFCRKSHKWLFSPPGCGFFMGGDSLDRLWPASAMGWDNKPKARRPFHARQHQQPRAIDGMLAGVRFLKSLGEGRLPADPLAGEWHARVPARDYLDLITRTTRDSTKRW
jgi:hypothetical protein